VNLPNRLTLARIILIPVFMTFLLLKIPKGHEIIPYQDVVAAIIFILAAATDGLDGYIARKRHQVTNLGKFMDPLADGAWIILAREFAVTGLRAIAAVDKVVISASKLGKIKTVSQVIAISAILLHDWPLSLIGIHIGQPFLYIALFFTVISGLDYLRKARKLLHK